MKKFSLPKIWICLLAAAGILMLAGGCQQLKTAAPQNRAGKNREAAAVYDLACTGMGTAGNMDEFAVALTSLDDITGLDFSQENPAPLIRAIRHGISLMEAADMQTKTMAHQSRSREKRLKEKIKTLEQEVKTLRHQISVLENIDQERQEKRKTQ